MNLVANTDMLRHLYQCYFHFGTTLESETLDRVLDLLEKERFSEAMALYQASTGESAATAMRTVKRLRIKQIADKFPFPE